MNDTITPAADVKFAFLQAQMLLRVGAQTMDDADERWARIRLWIDGLDVGDPTKHEGLPLDPLALIHVEGNGNSGVHFPAVYGTDAERLVLDRRIRQETITSLRRVADALEAHLAQT